LLQGWTVAAGAEVGEDRADAPAGLAGHVRAQLLFAQFGLVGGGGRDVERHADDGHEVVLSLMGLGRAGLLAAVLASGWALGEEQG